MRKGEEEMSNRYDNWTIDKSNILIYDEGYMREKLEFSNR